MPTARRSRASRSCRPTQKRLPAPAARRRCQRPRATSRDSMSRRARRQTWLRGPASRSLHREKEAERTRAGIERLPLFVRHVSLVVDVVLQWLVRDAIEARAGRQVRRRRRSRVAESGAIRARARRRRRAAHRGSCAARACRETECTRRVVCSALARASARSVRQADRRRYGPIATPRCSFTSRLCVQTT